MMMMMKLDRMMMKARMWRAELMQMIIRTHPKIMTG
jgi:hypothetical protein